MTNERRQYTTLRWVVIGTGLMAMTALAVTSVRLWPFISRAWFPAKLHCGCATVAMQSSGWMTGLAATALAASLIMVSRFSWTFVRHLRRSRRYGRRLRRTGWRAVIHQHQQTAITVVNVDEPIAVTLGMLRPKIILSQGLLKRLTASEVSSVIAHEREHQRVFDPLVTALMDSLLRASPKFPGASQTMAAAYSLRELSADAGATNGYQTAAALSSAFLKLSQLEAEPTVSAFSPNRDRLEKLLDQNWQYTGRWWSWTAALTIGLVMVGMVAISRAAQAATPTKPQTAAICHETIVMCQAERPFSSSVGWWCSAGLCSIINQPWSPQYAITLVR